MGTSSQRICFFGISRMGSWQIRARQIASARSVWTSSAELTPHQILDHDAFCAVKRIFRGKMAFLRRLGRIVVYDVLDCWRQPEDDLRCDDAAKVRRWFEQFLRDLPADGVIFPNRTMLEDFGDLVPNPICIYHHFRPDLEPIEVRRQARVVGYEGEARYLGEWHGILERECRKRDLEFVVNPADFRSIDIGIAARSGAHGSLLAHRYKSNVKLANFYGAAVPCLVSAADLSYRETDNGEVRFFDSVAELQRGLDELLSYETRLRVHRSFLGLRESYSLAAKAREYEEYFASLAGARGAAVSGAGHASRSDRAGVGDRHTGP